MGAYESDIPQKSLRCAETIYSIEERETGGGPYRDQNLTEPHRQDIDII